MSKPLGTQIGEGTKSRRSSPGPVCTQCNRKLVKKNNLKGRYYECPRHGFARAIVPIYPNTIKEASNA